MPRPKRHGQEEDDGSTPSHGAAGFLPAARAAAADCRGCGLSVTRERGRVLQSQHAPFVVAALHPSALLRIRESDARRAAFEQFVADLSVAKDAGLAPPR
jgi:hypothetical protein